jgi:hypothetical protein
MGAGGRALDGLRAFVVTEPNQTTNAGHGQHGSRTPGDEFRGREGNSPDPRLRS